jgi:hypothetical protein
MIYMGRGLCHIEKGVFESTSYLLPLASETNFIQWYMQNIREHQLSSVCLAVPFWLAVK